MGIKELVMVKALSSVDIIIGIDIPRMLNAQMSLNLDPLKESIELDMTENGCKVRRALVGERIAESTRHAEGNVRLHGKSQGEI